MQLVFVKNPGQSLNFFPATWFVLIILIAHDVTLQNMNKSNTNDSFILFLWWFVSINDWQKIIWKDGQKLAHPLDGQYGRLVKRLDNDSYPQNPKQTTVEFI